MPKIVKADRATDHVALMAIAKQHKATNAFGHIMFSSQDAYDRGWIRKIIDEIDNVIVGFTCVRHKVREPKTSLYYIAVEQSVRHLGYGQLLLDDLKQQSPHRCIELSCLQNNEPAIRFYQKNGFCVTGEALKGKGLHFELKW